MRPKEARDKREIIGADIIIVRAHPRIHILGHNWPGQRLTR